MEYQQQLAAVELDPGALTGRFRLRMLPLVLEHLELAARRASPAERTRVCMNVLGLEPVTPQVDFEVWRSMV